MNLSNHMYWGTCQGEAHVFASFDLKGCCNKEKCVFANNCKKKP